MPTIQLTDVTLRVIDAWVAEELFGWRWWKFETHYRLLAPSEFSWCDKEPFNGVQVSEPDRSELCHAYPPPFTRDANADAQVREKVRGMERELSAPIEHAVWRLWCERKLGLCAWSNELPGDWAIAAFCVAHDLDPVEVSKHLGRE